MAIVVPDGMLGNISQGYVRSHIKSVADVVAIVDLPLETFLPSTSTKTSLLVLRKKCAGEKQERVFLSVPKKCGHDRRGKPLFREDGSVLDDLPAVTKEFKKWKVRNAPSF